MSELGLRQSHYYGQTPPELKSDAPQLDPFREALGLAVYLTRSEAPPGWLAGWYLIPNQKGRGVLENYPVADWHEWQS